MSLRAPTARRPLRLASRSYEKLLFHTAAALLFTGLLVAFEHLPRRQPDQQVLLVLVGQDRYHVDMEVVGVAGDLDETFIVGVGIDLLAGALGEQTAAY